MPKAKSVKKAAAARSGPGITILKKINAEAKRIRTANMRWPDAIKKASANLKKSGKIPKSK